MVTLDHWGLLNLLIVLDLDGTLLNSKKEVSKRNIQAIVNCHRKGLKIAIATARPPRSVVHFIPKEIHDIASFIYYNGGYICDQETGFEQHIPISKIINSEILDYCSLNIPSSIISIEVKDIWLSNREITDSSIYNLKASPLILNLEQLKEYSPTKILITEFGNSTQFVSSFKDKTSIVVTDNGKLIQIMNQGVSKATGLILLCEHLKIPLTKTIVFGDDYNDIEMFKESGYSVAMGNAVLELKKSADEVTDTNDNDGVAKVLERYVLG